jgi:DNA-binding transcriptional ArsR family regulator
MLPAQPKLASTAFLIADPARAAMLIALVGGKAMPAGELACVGGVTAQTASSHLSKLLAGGLVAVEAQGRRRYYRLASPEVAVALESLATIAATDPPRRIPKCRHTQSLKFARCCYNHLAGALGVSLTRALEHRQFIAPTREKRYEITPAGVAWFTRVGLGVAHPNPTKHSQARQCLDWTEREYHLGGPLGAHFLSLLCERKWLFHNRASRTIAVTPAGWIALQRELGHVALPNED